MNPNSNAIFTLCSRLCVGDGIAPLEPQEWGDLAIKLIVSKLQPGDLLNFSRADFKNQLFLSDEYIDRISALIDRNASLSFELSKLENIGVTVVTRADKEYPAKLKSKLNNNCPPMFYVAGDLKLLNYKYVGYVGSRTVSDDDIEFTRSTVSKTTERGFGVVSGGARGVDTAAEEQALESGARVIEYLSDSMMKKMKKSAVSNAVADGKMLLLSVVKPDAGFNVGIAMMRNRYIYAQSSGTVVVRSEYNKGGTWTGAAENLKYGWCAEFCRDKQSYQGNKALISKGAIPVDESWDGDVEKAKPANATVGKQITLFN